MAAKRKSKTTPRPVGKRPAVALDKQDLESIALPAPVDVPVPGDDAAGGLAATDATARRKTAAPKNGPAGGGFTGVGRGQATPQARRYAFRRS